MHVAKYKYPWYQNISIIILMRQRHPKNLFQNTGKKDNTKGQSKLKLKR